MGGGGEESLGQKRLKKCKKCHIERHCLLLQLSASLFDDYADTLILLF
jgi:hypothetical protein